MNERPRIAIYWAASCGGCEVSVLNLHERILALDAAFELVFCPCLMDAKYSDLRVMADGDILITLFNGAIRTEENSRLAKLLRAKSKMLIAFGSCAYEGCIPALANLSSREALMRTVYIDNPSIDNVKGVLPVEHTKTPEGDLTLPEFYTKVRRLEDVVDVDYFIPGCPPEPERIWDALASLLDIIKTGMPLPLRGSVLGAGHKAVCEECEREKQHKRINRLYRTFEIIPDREKCLLEQGIICMGVATRNGCGALCPKVNMPCTGCYGPVNEGLDQGARMVAALGSILDIGDVKGLAEDEINSRIDEILDVIPDLAGTFYKYSLAGSILKGRL